MLSLYWTPGKLGGVPADPSWAAAVDTLAADAAGVVVQRLPRAAGAITVDAALRARLDRWLAHRSPAAPVTVMVHGFQYDPRVPMGGGDDPFGMIYGMPGPGGPHAQLSLLPLVGECDEAGGHKADVAIAFSWLSEGSFEEYGSACWNNGYQLAALDMAPLAARGLAAVLAHLGARGVQVRVLAHSLGTRVVTQAIGMLGDQGLASGLERVVLLAGAEFSVDASAVYAGCGFDVVSLGSLVDTVLWWGGSKACHPVRPNNAAVAEVIGRSGLGGNARWVDLQLDSPKLVAWAASGHAPTGRPYALDARALDRVHAQASMNHWASYTNPGNRVFVRDLVLHAGMGVSGLHAAGVPDGVAAPMWGRFAGFVVPETPSLCSARGGAMVIAGDQPGG